MRLLIAAAGRLKSGPELELVADYRKRAAGVGKPLGFSQLDIVEIEAPKGLKGPSLKNKEAQLLLAAAPDGAKRIALHEKGKSLASAALAETLAAWRDDGAPAAAFFIGGADGHGQDVLDKADLRLALGPATWPHMLVRVMLTEQIYRATTILAGHPYHRV
ncbi:MAG: 23S rRNA (pseudouridine(1915)-N(3))-methyltransferase RlmH [Pseudomonadota bacterium]